MKLTRRDAIAAVIAGGAGTGAVGRYFMDHPAGDICGILDEETNQNPIGFHTRESPQFYDHESSTPGSFKLEVLNTNPTSPVEPVSRARTGT